MTHNCSHYGDGSANVIDETIRRTHVANAGLCDVSRPGVVATGGPSGLGLASAEAQADTGARLTVLDVDPQPPRRARSRNLPDERTQQ